MLLSFWLYIEGSGRVRRTEWMECNRDEALRAKEISERKFLAKDIKGARKFALKAQNLYPELEGISQMVATLEVHMCAEEEKVHGEPNWYGVLGLTPLADDETVKKQYRKLALLLHPDKNRSIGAEGAFKLVSQAWGVMSDKLKKTAYDQRRRLRKNQVKSAAPSPSPPQSGFYNFANTAASHMKPTKGHSKKNASSSSHSSRKRERNTFWTVCHWCKMQYEYLRMYLNHNLLCPNCKEAYFAVEITPPSTKGTKISSDSMRNSSATQPGTSGLNHSKGSNTDEFQWVPFSESNGARSAVQAANMVQQAYEKIKRERQKAQAAARKEAALQKKNLASKRTLGAESSVPSNIAKRRKGVDDSGLHTDTVNQVNIETVTQGQVNISGLKHGNLQDCAIKVGGVNHVDRKQLLIIKAREEILKKLNDSTSFSTGKNAASEKVTEITEKGGMTNVKDGSAEQHPIFSQIKDAEGQLPLDKLDCESSGHCPDAKFVDQVPVNVLGSDFHDFDKDRTEECFRDNQIWAVYDDDDGMPRHYALIHNVISLNPFKVRVSWLKSLTHSGLGHVNWFLSGSSKTCGQFRVGKAEICNSVDAFSHRVRCTKLTSKTFQIFPRKGDVWALYRNWLPEWDELTEDEVIHKYDIVEVLEDYNEELGVIVIPLVKVAGFKSVFHQHMDPMVIKRIPNKEMPRFSHQVPAHLLTSLEGLRSPTGFCELDPAAIPSDILQAISDVEQIELIESDDEIEFLKVVDPHGNTIPNMMEAVPDSGVVECH